MQSTSTYTSPTVSSSGAHGHASHNKKVSLSANSSGNTNVMCHSTNSGQTDVAASNQNYIAHTAHTHTLTGGGVANNTAADASQAHNNMPPYKNVYIWERTE